MHEFIPKAEKLLAEIRRRWNERALERYVPSPPQEAFHSSTAPIRLFIAANGCGKTTCMVAEVVAQAMGHQPWTGKVVSTPPVRCLIVARDFTHSMEEDIIEKLAGTKRFLPESMIEKRDRLANGKVHKYQLKNGSSIKLMSYEQDPMAFEGLDWDFIGLNEPPPRSIWDGISRGRAKSGGQVVFAMTPIGGESAWIYDQLYTKAPTDPDIDVIHATLEDSFMSPKDRELFLANLDEDDREARVYGRFRHLAGRIYKSFDQDVHILRGEKRAYIEGLIGDPAIPKGLAMDPHDRKPFFLAYWLMLPDNSMVFFHEWPEGDYQQMSKHDWAVPDYARYIEEYEAAHGFSCIWRVADPNSAVRRNVITDETIVDVFVKHGIVFSTDVTDSLADGHLAVKDRLRFSKGTELGPGNSPRLFVTDDCPNIINGFLKYTWEDRRQDMGRVVREKPNEYAKDPMDVVRYACVAAPNYFDPRELAQLQQMKPRRRGYF